MGLGVSEANFNLWKLNYEYGELNANGTVDASKNTGNLAKQTISFDGASQPFVQTYKYDALYRLIEADENSGSSQNWKQTFGYDKYGNRTAFSQVIGSTNLPINSETLPSIDTNTNRFNASQGYTYDKAGNLVGDAENRTFVFNGDNKQVEVKDASNNVIGTYYYDGDGKRIKKVTANEETVFVYSGGKLAAEYSTDIAPQASTKYVATDTLGSIRAISDQNGDIVSRRDFMPFGEEMYAGTPNRDASQKYSTDGDNVRQKFTGYERDKETGLDFAEARYYKNNHGRFTAVDPLLASGKSADPQTFNRYAYVMNSPLIVTDPTGMQAGCDPKIAGDCQVSSNGGENSNIEFNSDEFRFQLKTQSLYADTVLEDSRYAYEARILSGIESGLEQSGIKSIIDGQFKGVANFAIDNTNLAMAASVFNNGMGIFASYNYLAHHSFSRYQYEDWTESIVGNGTEIGLGLIGPSKGAGTLSKTGKAGNVLLDSSVLTYAVKNRTLSGLIREGETPIISAISRPEMRNAVLTGSLKGVPKVIDNFGTLNTRTSLNTRINIRGTIRPGKVTKKTKRGLFGDGIIGAQSIESGTPLITNDDLLFKTVQKFGGRARFFTP